MCILFSVPVPEKSLLRNKFAKNQCQSSLKSVEEIKEYIMDFLLLEKPHFVLLAG